MKYLLCMIGALVLSGCGIQLPTTEGSVEFTDDGKLKEMSYESTKAQSGFHGEYNPETKQFLIKTDKADSPRGYEDYVQAQMMAELKRIEFYQTMVDALLESGKSAAPGP